VHQVTISPEVAGRVVELKFESGANVKAGDVLVQLDDQTERADLASYQAQARLAQLNLARSQALAQKQFSSKQSVDEQKSLLDQANAGIAKSQATIAYKVIKAPFDGMLGIRQINLGEYLNAGAAVVTLTDLDHLYIDFTLPEQDRGQLIVGQDVEIRVDAFPKRIFPAKLETIDPQVDPAMRAVRLRAALANPDHLLQPGMYGKVAVVLPSEPDVVTIPETAIDYSVYGESAFVVRDGKDKEGKPQLTVEQVFVTTGARNNGKVGILKGVAAGDQVVVGGQLKLHTGAPVTISKDRSLENPAEMPVE
jgi:multidrug efflux system membrane fusion protein